MPVVVLLTAVVILLCVFSDRISGKIGVPALLIFIGIGILFGSDGFMHIPFEDYSFASNLCECALIIIMFTGGFSMRWDSARPTIIKAGALATLGVAVTAGVTCAFCYFVLKFQFAESLLLGSVISSTDAASVFSVLRSKKLNLKNGIAPLLEAESGSNDPFSYMLTVISLSLFARSTGGSMTGDPIVVMMMKQLVFGALFGIVIGVLGAVIAKRCKTQTKEFECIMYLAFALMAYGFPALVGGNGYLSVYIAGVIIGNVKSPVHKYGGKTPLKKFIRNTLGVTIAKSGTKIAPPEAVVFLNGTTGVCQIAVFFLLGLLCNPSQLVASILPAVSVFLCLTLISRPLAVAFFCGKSPIRDRIFIAFCGLRGASSIVFAIMATVSGIEIKHNNLFNIVFCVCLMSMTIQGTLLPAAAKKLNLIDSDADVLKTFNDYKEKSAITMMRMYIPENHNWDGRQISEISMPTGSLAVMINRDGETIIPRGDTVIHAGDSVIMSVPPYESDKSLRLREIPISSKHIWLNRKIHELNLPPRLLIVMVQRGEQRIIPSGATEILLGDVVVITDTEENEESEE